MTDRKRKKTSRLRGSHTHGWGAKKKHRGAGSRGGRGMAGSGKRADTKKPSIWKNKKYFGRHGFKILKKEKINAINLSYFEEKLSILLSKKVMEEKNGFYIIDTKKIGINKVLGSGKITKKFKISSRYFSKSAIEKIKSAGGEAIITKKEKIEVKQEKKEESKKPIKDKKAETPKKTVKKEAN